MRKKLIEASKNTPPLPRADGKGGVFDISGISAYSGQSIVGNIMPNGICKADGLTVVDS